MMGLTPEQIKALLNQPEKPKRRAGTKKTVDTSVRDYQTWFKLSHKLLSRSDEIEINHCENPNCCDPRKPKYSAMGKEIRTQFCTEIDGKWMCRYCFLDGWLLEDVNQIKIA